MSTSTCVMCNEAFFNNQTDCPAWGPCVPMHCPSCSCKGFGYFAAEILERVLTNSRCTECPSYTKCLTIAVALT